MNSISRVGKVHDQIVKDLLWSHEQEIQKLREEIEQIKRPTSVIGFHQNPSASIMEIAFPRNKFKGGD